MCGHVHEAALDRQPHDAVRQRLEAHRVVCGVRRVLTSMVRSTTVSGSAWMRLT